MNRQQPQEGTQEKRPVKHWHNDNVGSGPSSIDILVDWLTEGSNYKRWLGDDRSSKESKESLCTEINSRFAEHHITGRQNRDIRSKIQDLQRRYFRINTWISAHGCTIAASKKAEGFSDEVVANTLRGMIQKKFKYYFRLLPIIAGNPSDAYSIIAGSSIVVGNPTATGNHITVTGSSTAAAGTSTATGNAAVADHAAVADNTTVADSTTVVDASSVASNPATETLGNNELPSNSEAEHASNYSMSQVGPQSDAEEIENAGQNQHNKHVPHASSYNPPAPESSLGIHIPSKRPRGDTEHVHTSTYSRSNELEKERLEIERMRIQAEVTREESRLSLEREKLKLSKMEALPAFVKTLKELGLSNQEILKKLDDINI